MAIYVQNGHMIKEAEAAIISWTNQRNALYQQMEALVKEIKIGNKKLNFLLADPKPIAVRQADKQISKINKILQKIV